MVMPLAEQCYNECGRVACVGAAFCTRRLESLVPNIKGKGEFHGWPLFAIWFVPLYIVLPCISRLKVSCSDSSRLVLLYIECTRWLFSSMATIERSLHRFEDFPRELREEIWR